MWSSKSFSFDYFGKFYKIQEKKQKKKINEIKLKHLKIKEASIEGEEEIQRSKLNYFKINKNCDLPTNTDRNKHQFLLLH